MPTALLDDRAVLTVTGEDAEHFLQNILTVDLDALEPGVAKPGALLTPQGKILFDFLISRRDGGFDLDCRAATADDFLRRLMMYRLRAKVAIAKQDQGLVEIAWQDDSAARAEGALTDARFTAISPVTRRHMAQGAGARDAAAWHAFRIASGVPESGDDYALGDAFPHDVLLDQNGGVGFRKGCYVGQEVVSRMQHRGTARRRFLIAEGKIALPAPGSEISAGGRAIGTLGSVSGTTGLALVRIDKVKGALDERLPILAGDVELSLTIPAWTSFTCPDTVPAGDDA